MNLPISLDFYSDEEETNNISYIQTVNGEKLRVKTLNTTDYVDNFVYEDG